MRLHKHSPNPYIRRRKAQDRERRKLGLCTHHKRTPVTNRAQLARELMELVNLI